MADNLRMGVVGGTGQLGSAIATAWLASGEVAPEDLWISNRTGTATGFEHWPSVNCTASNQELADHCDVILLSVPPAHASSIGLSAPDKLVISIMAGHLPCGDLQPDGKPQGRPGDVEPRGPLAPCLLALGLCEGS